MLQKLQILVPLILHITCTHTWHKDHKFNLIIVNIYHGLYSLKQVSLITDMSTFKCLLMWHDRAHPTVWIINMINMGFQMLGYMIKVKWLGWTYSQGFTTLKINLIAQELIAMLGRGGWRSEHYDLHVSPHVVCQSVPLSIKHQSH